LMPAAPALGWKSVPGFRYWAERVIPVMQPAPRPLGVPWKAQSTKSAALPLPTRARSLLFPVKMLFWQSPAERDR